MPEQLLAFRVKVKSSVVFVLIFSDFQSGLNVEQRKRLTIGVELVAKPDLLLFLDEPTSGLDSQTAWYILTLIRKLADNGQAILCTIHQPSAVLFQRFDRLLLLTRGGQTVYFGDIGENSRTLVDYFENGGATPCDPERNPAEWMLEVIGAAPGATAARDWVQAWKDSSGFVVVNQHLDELKDQLSSTSSENRDLSMSKSYAAPFHVQLFMCTKRAFEQSWRDPSYIYSKIGLCSAAVSLEVRVWKRPLITVPRVYF
jgi:ATP-binding cassette subfamily G (WHITE) protein 2 (PDR)